MNPTSVHDRGNLHKYRTEIPNLVLEMLAQGKLSRHAVTLYLVLKRTAGDDGLCWKSSQRLQEECSIGAGLLVAAKRELSEAGLIKITEASRPTGRPFHRIMITDIWPENMAYFSQNPQSDACSDTERRSSDTEHPCSDTEPKKNTNKNKKTKTPTADADGGDQNSAKPTTFTDTAVATIEAVSHTRARRKDNGKPLVWAIEIVRHLDRETKRDPVAARQLFARYWADRNEFSKRSPRDWPADLNAWLDLHRGGESKVIDGRTVFWSKAGRDAAPLVIRA